MGGVMRMEVQLRLRVLKKALRERTWSKEPLRVSDRVVCLISAPGRFNEGDVGIIVGMTDIGQTLVRLDRQAAAEPDKPIAQFCLRRLDINDQRQVHNGRLQKRVGGERPSELEPLLAKLFSLHDLNGDGVLEEQELVKLNEKIAMMHYGKDTDLGPVRQKYRDVFRSKLDARGHAVLYPTFRSFMKGLLDELDPHDEEAQEMIVEQWIAEAKTGREAFYFASMASESDLPFIPNVSMLPDARIRDDLPASRGRRGLESTSKDGKTPGDNTADARFFSFEQAPQGSSSRAFRRLNEGAADSSPGTFHSLIDQQGQRDTSPIFHSLIDNQGQQDLSRTFHSFVDNQGSSRSLPKQYSITEETKVVT